MNTVNTDAVHKLEISDKNVYNQGITILLKLLDNIIDHPTDPKYRCIRLENKKIKEELLVVNGMKQLLIEIGFRESDDGKMVLPNDVLLVKLKRYRQFIKERHDTLSSSTSKKTVVREIKIIEPVSHEIMVDKLFADRVRFPKVLTTNNSFLQSLESMSDSVMQYEDPILQQSALKIIPTETLKQRATENLRKIQKQILAKKFTDEEPRMELLVLMELSRWFKESFFRWINKLPCKICGNEDTNLVQTDTKYGVRVEIYRCPKPACRNQSMEFYRYNDVAKLLKTRSGRCGEWANCFTFLCRAMGYDARYIFASFDHVWTEVYDPVGKRWIHVDPSENVFDSPLMYEHGWKRSVAYVLAFARDDVQDVTPRYSNKMDAVLQTRTSCSERELLKAIVTLRGKRQADCTPARKKFLVQRTLRELVEFTLPRQPTENELKGRSSGSLAWRLERGEEQINNFYVFTLTEDEIRRKEFNVRYSCAKDHYERYSKSAGVQHVASKWESLHFISDNIFRKVERDWKMVYLARNEGTNAAFITWKFDFSAAKQIIKTVNLKLETKTYETGTILVRYFDKDGKQLHSLNDVSGLDQFSLRIDMSGGKGDIQWQHTQLFRQSLSSTESPFDLAVTFC